MLYATADIGLMLLIGKGGSSLAYRMEIVRFHIGLVDGFHERIELCLLTEGDELHGVVEMVEDDDILIHNIIYIRCIVLLHRRILHGNVLEVSHGIKGCETIQTAALTALPLNMESLDKVIEGFRDGEFAFFSFALTEGGQLFFLHSSVGIGGCHHSMSYGDTCYGVHTDEGTRILCTMIVGTLHQRRLWINIS